ncbi:HNH endonuclease signature motif containing protein [Mycobacterium servetii]|uniref:HNH endonuclease signature motif containing protein n=1 Tax=Mycobacterium servetii TaxID=3237418 RepID=UPI00350F21A2
MDAVVDRHDPAALRRTRAAARGRDVVITPPDDQSGIANLWGAMFATDAAVLERRLSQLAHDVCDDDPRTVAQRRADALGALAAGAERLACNCGNERCPAAGPDARATAVVVHVFADAAALDTPPDPHLSGEVAAPKITAQTTLAEALAPAPEPDVPAGPKPPTALIAGGAVLPSSMLAELVRGGAKVRPVRHPGDSPPEPGYRPSAALQRFIRCRDLTCRFPGCDRPAEFADIDHTIPYPLGPTHPSNLKCLCRKHHLLKTFWTGWRDRQHPDGVIVWTSPSGHEYITRPGSRLLFPALSLPTGELPAATTTLRPTGNRGIMMPTRRRTRKQDRARRIDAERNERPPF